jgi:hypothetical protein
MPYRTHVLRAVSIPLRGAIGLRSRRIAWHGVAWHGTASQAHLAGPTPGPISSTIRNVRSLTVDGWLTRSGLRRHPPQQQQWEAAPREARDIRFHGGGPSSITSRSEEFTNHLTGTQRPATSATGDLMEWLGTALESLWRCGMRMRSLRVPLPRLSWRSSRSGIGAPRE